MTQQSQTVSVRKRFAMLFACIVAVSLLLSARSFSAGLSTGFVNTLRASAPTELADATQFSGRFSRQKPSWLLTSWPLRDIVINARTGHRL